MLKKLLVLSLLCLVSIQMIRADEARGPNVVTILLKNEGKIEGVIIKETEEGVFVDVGFGTVAVSKKEIEEVEYPPDAEKGSKLREWRRHRIETKKNIKRRKRDEEAVERRIKESVRIKESIAEKARREEGYRIKFTNTSRIRVEAVLNDEATATLLVDTGATAVVIPLEVAEQLPGVDLSSARKVESKLADGTIREAIPIMLRSVEVGDMRAENVEAVAMDLQGKDGLLGMSFLSRFHVGIDTENNEFIIRKK